MDGTSFNSRPDLIVLTDGNATVEVAPATGGSVASFFWMRDGRRHDWFRPATADALAHADPFSTGCFPLVPYSNRIRNGRFDFAERRIALPVTSEADPHYEHGHGWRRPWSVVERASRSLTIELDHPVDEWPWHYRARQRLALTDAGRLSIELSLSNLDCTAMPAGMGLHPYFPRSSKADLTAAVGGMWAVDKEILPTELVAPQPPADPRLGMTIAEVDLDNAFPGWSGQAEIRWPESGARLIMEAEGPLGFLVLYTPPTEPYFCAEPVSNATDAFNLAAAGRTDTGMIVLAPGETLQATVRFAPEFINAH